MTNTRVYNRKYFEDLYDRTCNGPIPIFIPDPPIEEKAAKKKLLEQEQKKEIKRLVLGPKRSRW